MGSEEPEQASAEDAVPFDQALTDSLEKDKNADSGEQEVARSGGGQLSPYFPSEILQWEELIVKAGKKFGVDPNLYAALIKKESWFPKDTYPEGYQRCPDGPSTPSCTSTSGALGIGQVMPFHFVNGENGRDPKTNIFKGVSILANYIAKKGGDIRLGLAAYYCGPNKTSYGAHCLAYADQILEWYREAQKQMP